MKYPFLAAGFAFAAGLLAGKYLLWPFHYCLSLFALWGMGCFGISHRKTRIYWIFGGYFLLGVMNWKAAGQASGTAVFSANGEDCKVSGRVAQFPERTRGKKSQGIQFVLQTEEICRAARCEPLHERLQVILYYAWKQIDYADRLEIMGRLSLPPAALNPGLFDYREYLRKQGISGVLRGYGPESARILASPDFSWGRLLYRFRENIYYWIQSDFPAPENEILAALLIGKRRGIARETEDAFARTGVAHVLAVSGLNVSIVSGMVFLALRLLGLYRKLAAAGAVVFVVFYVLLAGDKPPVMRAGIMAGIYLLGIMLEERARLLNSLGLAFLLLLIWRPYYLWAAELQLSFLCVLFIFLFTERDDESLLAEEKDRDSQSGNFLLNYYARLGAASFAAFLGACPVILYYFNNFSCLSLLANMLIVPLINLATFAGFALLPFYVLGWSAAGWSWVPVWLIRASVWINDGIAAFSFSALYFTAPDMKWIMLYYGVLLFIIYGLRQRFWPKPSWAVIAGCFAGGSMLVVFILAGNRPLEDAWYEIKLRQGRAAYLQMPGKQGGFLLHAGSGQEWDWTLQPFLKQKGVNRLEGVILFAVREKDSAGLAALMERFHCRKVFIWAKAAEQEPYVLWKIKEKIQENGGQVMLFEKSPEIPGIRPGTRVFQGIEKMLENKVDHFKS